MAMFIMDCYNVWLVINQVTIEIYMTRYWNVDLRLFTGNQLPTKILKLKQILISKFLGRLACLHNESGVASLASAKLHGT